MSHCKTSSLSFRSQGQHLKYTSDYKQVMRYSAKMFGEVVVVVVFLAECAAASDIAKAISDIPVQHPFDERQTELSPRLKAVLGKIRT